MLESGGNILGASVAKRLETRWRSAYLSVPASFTLPGAIFLVLALNIPSKSHGSEMKWLVYFLLLMSEACLWTMLAPIAAVNVNEIPPHLRARAQAISIWVQHVLGDMISPPIIGAISDAHGIRSGLQVTWAAVLLSGLSWGSGAFCLPALKVAAEKSRDGPSSDYFEVLWGSTNVAQDDKCHQGDQVIILEDQDSPLFDDSEITDTRETEFASTTIHLVD